MAPKPAKLSSLGDFLTPETGYRSRSLRRPSNDPDTESPSSPIPAGRRGSVSNFLLKRKKTPPLVDVEGQEELDFTMRLCAGAVVSDEPKLSRKQETEERKIVSLPRTHSSGLGGLYSPQTQRTGSKSRGSEVSVTGKRPVMGKPQVIGERLTPMQLMETFVKNLASPMSSKHIAGSILENLLEYMGATHLYFIRRVAQGEYVLDASMIPGKVWSLLEGTKINRIQMFPLEPFHTSRRQRRLVYIASSDELAARPAKEEERWTNTKRPIESILVLPVIIQNNLSAALYFSHYEKANAFDQFDETVLSTIALGLTNFLNTNAFRRMMKDKTSKVQLPSTQSLRDVKLQDTILVYEDNKWVGQYGVLADGMLHVFSSAWDTHPKQRIGLSAVRKVIVSGSSEAHDELIVPPLLSGKATKSHSLLYLRMRLKSASLWLALESLVAAQKWQEVISEMQEILDNPDELLLKIPANIRINVSDVTRGKIIGRGAAATVYAGQWNQTPVAIKQLLDQFNSDEEKAFFQEMNILQSIRHPNIVQLFGGYISDEGRASIVFELASRGSLETALYDRLSPLDFPQKVQILRQASKALEYLHGQNPPIIHRDLKPGNILVSSLSSIAWQSLTIG